MSWWAAYSCATHGHLRDGLGYGTNADCIVWADYCSRCGADLRHVSARVPAATPEDET